MSKKTFDIGKTTIDNKKHAPGQPLITNRQKEGSRVLFGVPKPTVKKRKFMEVSKHFSTNKNEKTPEPNNSVKFAKHVSEGWKVPTRNDFKNKQIVKPRPDFRYPNVFKEPLPARKFK